MNTDSKYREMRSRLIAQNFNVGCETIILENKAWFIETFHENRHLLGNISSAEECIELLSIFHELPDAEQCVWRLFGINHIENVSKNNVVFEIYGLSHNVYGGYSPDFINILRVKERCRVSSSTPAQDIEAARGA